MFLVWYGLRTGVVWLAGGILWRAGQDHDGSKVVFWKDAPVDRGLDVRLLM